MDCSPPGSSIHGLSQAKILKWVAIPSTGGLHIYTYEKLFKWVYYGKICVKLPCIHAEYTCSMQTLIKLSNQGCDTRRRLTWHNILVLLGQLWSCSKFGAILQMWFSSTGQVATACEGPPVKLNCKVAVQYPKHKKVCFGMTVTLTIKSCHKILDNGDSINTLTQESIHQLSSSCAFAIQKWLGFPGSAGGKEPTCQCRRCKRHRFDP